MESAREAFRNEINRAKMFEAIEEKQIEAIIDAAREAPRARSHLILHKDHSDLVQRLLIAGRPETFVRPHRHSEQWEMLIAVRGEVDVFIIAEDRTILKKQRLSTKTPVIQIPAGVLHMASFVGPVSVVLEIKPGPYRPNEFADWAPDESSGDAKKMLRTLATAHSGSRI